MRDGPFRRAIKQVALWNFNINVSATRWLWRRRGDRPFLLGGDCRRCARCCEAPGIHVGSLIRRTVILKSLFLLWQRSVNGFEFQEWDQDTAVFRCSHFDWASRSCDSYESRPGMCRDYPRLLLYQPSPALLPGCGYKAVAPNAKALRAALSSQPLSDEQRAKLRKGLFLGE